MGCHANILLRTNRREERQKQKLNYVGEGAGGEAETESLIL